MLAISTILLRLTGGNNIKVYGVDIPLDWAWVPITAFTLFHGIFTVEFVRSIRRYWELTEPSDYFKLFIDITTEGGLFMRGMTPRILPATGGPAPMGTELATWLTHAAAICLFFALLPSSGFSSLQAIPAYILTYLNWLIGSRWAIALSELAVRKEYATVLPQRLRKQQIPTVFDEQQSDNPASNQSPKKHDPQRGKVR